MRAAVYVKVGASDDRSDSATAQCRQVLEYVTDQGWTLVHVLADFGQPRSGFDELLERISSGAYDVVVAYSPDRLWRSYADGQRLSAAVDSAGVKVVTVTGVPILPLSDPFI